MNWVKVSDRLPPYCELKLLAFDPEIMIHNIQVGRLRQCIKYYEFGQNILRDEWINVHGYYFIWEPVYWADILDPFE